MFECSACKNLIQGTLYEYCQCPQCKSYNYLSDKSATKENIKYFNQHFVIIDNIKESPLKRKIFSLYSEKDTQLYPEMYQQFIEALTAVNKLLERPNSVLEIGFGQGDKLVQMLENGVDAYGIDISKAAVKSFIRKHPHYGNRVFFDYSLNHQLDVVYCCALFEHLDTPREFLQNAFHYLRKGGFLILDGFPVLNDDKPQLAVDEDINFWKPCHRIIYAKQSLVELVKQFGFELVNLTTNDCFTYRVLSLHIKKGFPNVIELRNPCLEHPGLPVIKDFDTICDEALQISSLALFGTAVFTKT